MAANYYDKFIAKLQEIFMMDHAELDFGIYRIMNQKREEISRFLNQDLLPQVKEVLQGDTGEAQNAKKRMAEIEQMFAGMDIETLPDSNPNVAEYKKLKAQLEQGGDPEAMQAEVFSHLTTFFSRYYDGGDFLSKRRYKDNTYAIPYNGEEVKLHWANADQYYIKTSEYFRNYTFVLPTSRRKVHFVLKDASTEQNNNKAQNNMERRFAIYQPEDADEPIIEVTSEGELNIYFIYELMPKATKQEDLKAKALEVVTPLIPNDFAELLSVKKPTAKNPDRSLLGKHLDDYTAKNSFDYFIHKDLGGFLSRELDFYIKNEVLHIDDLDPQHIQSQLAIVKAIKQVGQKIIRMLAQLENFQRKLWLKKKFVVQSDYCITLDRVSEKLYPAIIANDAQRKEWVRLFAIDEIKGDGMFTHAYSEPLTIEFLKENPFLVLDTAFFDAKFKHQLVASMENIDEQTNGLLINSENFQALELLQEKYRNRIRTIFSDPPYNTDASSIVYKNCYKDSSWLSLMYDRMQSANCLLSDDAIGCITIDDFEFHRLRSVMSQMYSEECIAGIVGIKNNPAGRSTAKGFSISHEYGIFFKTSPDTTIGRLEHSDRQKARYKFTDSKGQFEWVNFRKHGGANAYRTARPKLYYPIFIDGDNFKIPKMHFENGEYIIDEEIPKNVLVIYPITPNGEEKTWKWGHETVLENLDEFSVRIDQSGEKGIYLKSRLQEGTLPLTIWDKSEYSSTEYGTNLIKNMFGQGDVFSFPKSIHTVIDAIQVCNPFSNGIILDYFAGSATTAHAVISLNRKDDGNRKYLLCEVNEYCKSVTSKRIEKAIYSEDWRNGKPVSRKGISQCFKYIRLEQYEDTLNNLEIKKPQVSIEDEDFHETYMLSYLLDTETRDSLLNLKWFENPFEMTLKTTKDNELVETKVDMVETFNFLIGLNVETEDWYQDDNICVVQGRTHREGLKALVIWRNCKAVDNEALNAFFDKMDFRTRDTEFDIIYVNGDNTLPNLKRDEEHWKVVLTEEEFQKRMFENQ